MSGTVIKPCKCKDEQQDRMYGIGMRVHNIGGKGKDKIAYCTVCSPSTKRVRRFFTGSSNVPSNLGIVSTTIFTTAPSAGGKSV